MKKFLLLSFLVASSAIGAAAQNAKDAEKALRESLVKKQMFLRGYSAEAVVKWKWDGKQLVAEDPHVFTLGAVTFKTVKLAGDHLSLSGDRQTLVRTEGRNAQFSAEMMPVTIDVDLHGGNPAEVLPAVLPALFFSDMNGAIRDIPNEVVGLIPTPPLPKGGAKPTATECDCAHPSSCSDYIARIEMNGSKPPVVKSPEQSVAATADAPYITLVGVISDSGKLDQLWLGRPLAPASDAAVLTAATGSTFAPATCHDKPMTAAFRVDIPIVAQGRGRR